MGFLRFVLGLVAFAIAIKLVAAILTIASFLLKLVFLALVVGLLGLAAWVVYKLVSPRKVEQT